MIPLIISLVLLVIALVFVILQWCKAKAASLILLFLGQSLLIKNLHPDRRPDYIIKKVKENSQVVPGLVRPLVMWYIDNRGIKVATRLLQFLVNDLQSTETIKMAP
jgi:hypothetical protein